MTTIADIIGSIKRKVFIWLCLRDTVKYLKKHPNAEFRTLLDYINYDKKYVQYKYSDDLSAAYDFISTMVYLRRRRFKEPWDWKYLKTGAVFRQQLLRRAMTKTGLFRYKDYVGVQ